MKRLRNLFLWLAHLCQPKVQINREAIMAFEMHELIQRLILKFEMTNERAKAAFEGMKDYLYRCAISTEPISPPNEDVDEAWHQFMLHSSAYAKFCFTYIGFFIHHEPFSAEKIKELKAQMAKCSTDCRVPQEKSQVETCIGGGCMNNGRTEKVWCKSDCDYRRGSSVDRLIEANVA